MERKEFVKSEIEEITKGVFYKLYVLTFNSKEDITLINSLANVNYAKYVMVHVNYANHRGWLDYNDMLFFEENSNGEFRRTSCLHLDNGWTMHSPCSMGSNIFIKNPDVPKEIRREWGKTEDVVAELIDLSKVPLSEFLTNLKTQQMEEDIKEKEELIGKQENEIADLKETISSLETEMRQLEESPLASLVSEVKEFYIEQDQNQSYNEKDLATVLAIKASELQKPFLGKRAEDVEADEIKDELADVIIQTLLFVNKYDLDICQIVRDRLE